MAKTAKKTASKPGKKRLKWVKRPPKVDNRGLRHGLTCGKLPADAKYIEVRLNAFRRNVEQAIAESKGEVTLADAGIVQTAVRWERHAGLAQRWLNLKYKELKPADLLLFSREIAHASSQRDKALAALHLDKDSKNDIIMQLYSPAKELTVESA